MFSATVGGIKYTRSFISLQAELTVLFVIKVKKIL